MTLRDHVAVEPLEEERLARIERAIVAGLPARHAAPAPWRALVPWGVAALAAAAALIAWRIAARPAELGAPPPVVVAAAPDGTRVDLGDAVITTGTGATFTVTRPGDGVDVRLARGRIALEVASRKGRAPLVVHADDVAVTVVGTRFAVEWDDEVTVEVTEGLVRVARGGETAMVAAGQSWSRPAHVAVAALVPTPPVAAGASGSDDDAVPAPAAPSGAAASGAAASGAPIDVAVLRDHSAAAPPAPDQPTGAAAAGTAPPRGDRPHHPRDARPAGAAAPPEPIADLRKAIRSVAVPAAEDVGAGGDAALDAYRRMATEAGATGAAGLYGLARTQAMDPGASADALRNLDRYVERFPRGAELDAVYWLRLRVLCLRRVDDACRSAAHTYLGHAPADTSAARVAERVTVTE